MINLRTSSVIAGAAFVLSLLIGVVSRIPMPILLIRSMIFMVLFFIVSTAISLIISHFLPELLENDEYGGKDDLSLVGSHIDITEGDTSGGSPHAAHVFMGAQADDSDGDLGNISHLMGGGGGNKPLGEGPAIGMDQNSKIDYTNKGRVASEPGLSSSFDPLSTLDSLLFSGGGNSGEDAFPSVSEKPAAPEKPVVTEQRKALPKITDSDGVLPDLDSFAGAFLSPVSDEEMDTADFSVSAPAKKPSSRSKGGEWAEDLNAKDMAAGLRTVLIKDKEG